VRPRRLAGVGARPLNFTVRSPRALRPLSPPRRRFLLWAPRHLGSRVRGYAGQLEPTPWNGRCISAEATPLAIYVGAGITFCALAWLSLRYPVLTPGWAILTLALSVLLSLCGLGCALKVSLTGWGTLLGTVVWWALALTCSVCSYLLWGQRRASNNRSKGRNA
jgi:hypothetical protein